MKKLAMMFLLLLAGLLSTIPVYDSYIKAHAYDVAERFSTLETLEAGDVVVLSETKIDERIASEVLGLDESEVKEVIKKMRLNDASKLAEIANSDESGNSEALNNDKNNSNNSSGVNEEDSSLNETGGNENSTPNLITGNVVNEAGTGNGEPEENLEQLSNEDLEEKIKNKLEEKDSEIRTSTGKDKLIAAKAAIVKLTDQQNDPNIIGVVSSNPAFVMGFGSELKETNTVPIALVGRVPVKVSLENGAINIGDPLTSSSKKGYAAKATKSGRIIGFAMENYDEGSNAKKILVFVQPGWWQVQQPAEFQLENQVGRLTRITEANGSVRIRIG
ncbi:hypothetical protein HYS31_02355 [Candidatus Woesearchaeota archaeon]|nr:hypothetical protein [Candidatus Woesearchaeota archaeon]